MEGRQRVVVRGLELEDGARARGTAIGRRSVEVARGVGDDGGGRAPPVRAREAVEGRQRVAVGGVELEDGALIVGAAAEGRSVEVARGIGDEGGRWVASVRPTEVVEGRQRIAVRGVEPEHRPAAREAADPGRPVEVARGVGDDRGVRGASVGAAAEAVESRQRIAVRGVELEGGLGELLGRRSVEVARGVGDDRGARMGPVGPVEVVERRQRVIVRGVELENGAERDTFVLAVSRAKEVARSVGDDSGVRAVLAVEAVEGRQRVVVRGVELEDRALVSDVVLAESRSIEVARGIGDDRGIGVQPVHAVEAEKGDQRIVVRGVELEDRAVAVRAAADRRSIEIARGIDHDRGGRVFAVGAAEVMEFRQGVSVRGVELEDGAHAGGAAGGGRSVQVARGVGDDCGDWSVAVGAAEVVERRHVVAILRVELEDGAMAEGAACRSRSVEVARGVSDDGGFRIRSVEAGEVMECRQGIGVRGVELEDGAHTGGAAAGGRSVQIAGAVGDQPGSKTDVGEGAEVVKDLIRLRRE